jgi:predicted ATPase
MLQDFRCFKKGFTLDFEAPITILVGENGCGKSTLIDLIRNAYKEAGEDDLWMPSNIDGYCRVTGKKLAKGHVRYFDFHRSDMKYSGMFGDDIQSQILAQRASSGQGAMIQVSSSGVLRAERSLLLLDEVARGYSPRMQQWVGAMIYAAAEVGANQVILSTHSEHIMRFPETELDSSASRLYSVEHRKYMTYQEFIRAHLNKRPK